VLKELESGNSISSIVCLKPLGEAHSCRIVSQMTQGDSRSWANEGLLASN
jgi:hypothetical protein